ncbi:hypothetical protein C0J52_19425 [Blattella germanica]|nr:hypothetical protein C0J52_19425 [Blattella germanica]
MTLISKQQWNTWLGLCSSAYCFKCDVRKEKLPGNTNICIKYDMQNLPGVVVCLCTCRVSVMVVAVTMAGKPEPPQNHLQHHQQQQPPNVQNVVVYVSNENFAAQAYATAVNQQNVAASYPQQQSQQNGGTAVTFAPSTQSVAPLVAPIKNLKSPLIKTQDFQPSNGLIGNVSLPQQASFYASTNTPGGLVQTNGFHHGHVASTGNFITTTQGGDAASIVAVMGGEAGNTGSSTPSSGTVVFPRCDSVRSETAESSCSSLSSADSQPDAGTNSLTLLLPPSAAPVNSGLVPQNPASTPAGMVMLNNSVNVQQPGPQAAGIVRTLSQQQLGNIVLAMTVPPNNNNVIQSSNQPVAPSVPVQPVVPTITVPYGWKRLNINGAIVYIRYASCFYSNFVEEKKINKKNFVVLNEKKLKQKYHYKIEQNKSNIQ